MVTTYDPTLFQGAASYYVRYRSRYPQSLFDRIADHFQLSPQERLLDLGCGAGLVAIPFSDRFREVVAIDPDADMLKEAQAEAKRTGVNNIRWIHDRAESISEELGQFRLATFGRSFHWMQRELVAEKLRSLLTDDGGIVILKTGDDPWNSQLPWKKTAISVVKRWLGDQRRTGQAGQGTWKSLDVPHDVVLETAGFTQHTTIEVTFEKTWTVDSYLGYLYSTAFALPSFFGENREEFEADLKKSLLEIESSGNFTEVLSAAALIAQKSK
ncbi:MAG: class I SAM-dependent methyltransferase [Leptolyngbya sp. UWPOB_LEPTO1]|uniref:class I SAM-dependent methyltransferase n=1 Tax=Leptolyngbya sp. UWPOB_LEPTO1 TaxID=2815653 RepID=UPI001ACD77EF|nr:class I SAM-dependent methyltransferase [Leptolyngbya sp. UWPOB_LEPTO1]MBN8564617.1 class I SAM-dependent methyltransferase [Leptolyngbya sp. UWPOB_LEPTO1]